MTFYSALWNKLNSRECKKQLRDNAALLPALALFYNRFRGQGHLWDSAATHLENNLPTEESFNNPKSYSRISVVRDLNRWSPCFERLSWIEQDKAMQLSATVVRAITLPSEQFGQFMIQLKQQIEAFALICAAFDAKAFLSMNVAKDPFLLVTIALTDMPGYQQIASMPECSFEKFSELAFNMDLNQQKQVQIARLMETTKQQQVARQKTEFLHEIQDALTIIKRSWNKAYLLSGGDVQKIIEGQLSL